MVRRHGYNVLHPIDPLLPSLRQPKPQRAFSLRLVNQRLAQRNNKNIPHDQRAMDRGIPNDQIASRLAQPAIENQGQEYVMTTPMDDTLTAIGRQLSITYLPTVLDTWWPNSLHLKCAIETRVRPSRLPRHPSSHAEINGCHSLVKGHFRPVPGIQYDLRVALIVRETLTPKGPVVWRRC
jgi:hypothetical protein